MLTKQEAKEKCIAMWEHIAEHITDKEWRDTAIEEGGEVDKVDAFKEYAIEELFPDDSPNSGCYLCEYNEQNVADDDTCRDCPLSEGYVGGCMHGGRPFDSFCNNLYEQRYARAQRAAERLVEKVKNWEVLG